MSNHVAIRKADSFWCAPQIAKSDQDLQKSEVWAVPPRVHLERPRADFYDLIEQKADSFWCALLD
jgi:hypothetical protein